MFADPRKSVGNIVLVTSTRRVRDFPETGVVVGADSLLAGREELRTRITQWAPDGIIVDESHRLKTWTSTRSVAVRSIAHQVPGLRVAISGTPMLASPVELAAQLAISRTASRYPANPRNFMYGHSW